MFLTDKTNIQHDICNLGNKFANFSFFPPMLTIFNFNYTFITVQNQDDT